MNTRQRPRKRDGRSLDHKASEHLRLHAVERIESGERPVDVARSLGFDPAVISRWMSTYRREGIEALYSKKASGRPPRLSDAQVAVVRAIVVSTSPPVWRFPTVTWTRAMVSRVIEELFAVELSERQVGRILRDRMGLSPQRPLRRAFEADEVRVGAWLESEYPRIRDQAKAEGARIFFADESAVRSDYHSGTTWAPSGETPVVEKSGQRFAINLISAISPDGELRWMPVEGRMNGERFVEFLSRLIKGRRKPIYVIVDGHPSHKAKVVKRFLEDHQKRLKLFVLPPYSPQLNPDELVWNDLEHHTIGKRAFHTIGELKRLIHEHMEWLRHAPALIRRFFDEPHVRYAKLRRDPYSVRVSKRF